MKTISRILFAAQLLASTSPAAPGNDNFADAYVLPIYIGSTNGSNVEATKEPGEPNHAGDAGGHSVWYRWSPTFSGIATFNTFGSSFDTLLAVYTNPPALLQVAANDDAGVPQSRVNFSAFYGVTYYIAVDGYGGASGSVLLNWTEFPVYPNDNFSNATVLPGPSGTTFGCNIKSSREPGEPDHVGVGVVGGRTVWYQWTAPLTGAAYLSTAGSSFDTLLAVYTGDNVAALTPIVSNDDIDHGGYIQSDVSFGCAAGQTYEIVVDGNQGSTGGFQLNWESFPSPTNDAFANPMVVSGPSGLVHDCNTVATEEPGEPRHANVNTGGSLWYGWSAPRDGLVTFNTFGTFLDTVLAVYTGDVLTNLSLVAANDDAIFLSSQSRVQFSAQAGTNYHVVVAGFFNGLYSTPELGPFNLAWTMDPPPNDNFTNATTLGDAGQLSQSTMFATKEPGEPNHAGDIGGSSVWFTWTAPSNGPAFFDTAGSTFTTRLAVYTGDAINALSVVVSNQFVNESLFSSRVDFMAVGGQTYRVAVDGASGEQSFLQLSWGYPLTPQINIAAQGANVVLSWSAPNCYLETIGAFGTGGTNARWTALTGGSPFMLPARAAQQQFFRLIAP